MKTQRLRLVMPANLVMPSNLVMPPNLGMPPHAVASNAATALVSPALRSLPRSLATLIARHYPLTHPGLHLVQGALDLDRLPRVGRYDETGRLRVASLAVPYGLDGPWRHSPNASAHPIHVDIEEAMAQHARLTRLLLDRGVEVHLLLPHPRASEAVYATDVVTAIGRQAVVAAPLHRTRQLELGEYAGGLRLLALGPGGGPVEFGDVLLVRSGRTLRVLQGVGSWRSNAASVGRLRQGLEELAAAEGGRWSIEHVPVRLSGDGTLHLDYVLNYAGDGAKRVMTVCAEGLADPSDVERIARLLDVPAGRIVPITREEMLAGAANLASFGPDEVLMLASARTKRVADRLRALGLSVVELPYSQMSQKDGTVHCSIGQLARD